MSIFMIKKQKMSVFAPRRRTSKLVIPKKLQDLFFNEVVFVKLYNSFLLLQKKDSHQKGGTALFFELIFLPTSRELLTQCRQITLYVS